MDQRTVQMLFTLLRSAIRGTKLTEKERKNYSPEMLSDLLKISSKHDLAHLLVLGIKKNELIVENSDIEKYIFKAVYRYERTKHEYENLCAALEKAEISFISLKGSVIRKYYPEAWMRTSCDIDVLVHREDLDKAVSYLTDNYKYVLKERGTHDVSLYSPAGIHVELHFDLIEEGRAQSAIFTLQSVWENVSLHENSKYLYEMSDAFFYFYHIAHMAKHFETGGCGIRPFIDLWILDNMDGISHNERDALLSDGGLLQFASVARKQSNVWFGEEEPDELSLQMENFILHGGVYGSIENRVILQNKKKDGRLRYLVSRIFIPYHRLKRYYPVLEKHRWLTPFMQIRRWFMLFRPDVAKRTKTEIAVNLNVGKSNDDEMKTFIDNIGL